MRTILERQCDEVETVMEFTYLGDRVSAGGRYEAVVIARTRCWLIKHRECGELLYGRRFPANMKGAVYELCKASNAVCM